MAQAVNIKQSSDGLTINFQPVAHSDPLPSTWATGPLGLGVVVGRSSGHVSHCQGGTGLVDGCSCVHSLFADEATAAGFGT